MTPRARTIVAATYDVTAPPPSGTTVLEASAGTGKTHAIVALAARYIADGVDIDRLLLVTFSRMATAELRERTRTRLTTLAAGLADPDASGDDALVQVLAAAEPEVVALRRRRVVAALSDFDASTVSTTHTFCSRMLDALGIAGERDHGITLVEEVDELVTEVARDVYIKRFSGGHAPFSFTDADEIARAGVRHQQATLAPRDAAENSAAAARVDFVATVRREVARRKRIMRIRDYDELQSLLRDVVADPEHGAAARARVRQFFDVVLVDEFQDTDPVQWDILRLCFHGSADLVLVGDPKQSIYAFRGAEVLSYLDAAVVADNHQVLGTNWRSDAGLVTALDHLYGEAALGHPDIVVRPVDAWHTTSRLSGRTPLRLRYLSRTGLGPLGDNGFPTVAAVRGAVIDAVAADIARLLGDPPHLDDADGGRPLRPSDIVILLRTRATIAPMQRALRDVGVASVVGAGSSVFATDSARDWFHVLRALEQPTRSDRAALAAITPLIGRSPVDLDTPDGDVAADVGDLLVDLAQTLSRAGFAAMFDQLAERTDLAGRILSAVDGERFMTDLVHLASLCNRVMVGESRGVTGLLHWFADRLDDPTIGDQTEQSRRLDRDAQAVSIMTVHGSKGLEFPVVYVPFGWDSARNPSPSTVHLHDADGRRILDVGGKNDPGFDTNVRAAQTEDAGEELRLFYVSVTRARSQVVLWWAPATTARRSPLHRLLFARNASAATTNAPDPAVSANVPADATAAKALQEWGRPMGELISVEHVDGTSPAPVLAPDDPQGRLDLRAATFDAVIDDDWRRTSYSALVADHHLEVIPAGAPTPDDGVGPGAAEPEAAGTVDEPEEVTATSGGGGAPSLMNTLPAGAAFGTVVHAVLEEIDTDADDLTAEIADRCRRAAAVSGLDMNADVLATAITGVLTTPLGIQHPTDTPTADDLAGLGMPNRLSELDFEFPLAATGGPTVAAIADLLERHLPPGDPLRAYPDHLRDIGGSTLRGFLTGSIDLVARIGAGSGHERYVIADYKTNRLGVGDLGVEDYRPEAMAQEMIRSHYPLQALLYSVALHRYLRWRLADYDPHRHLGPVCYLFVRAMIGPDTPPGCGVFTWELPPVVVTELSNVLAGR
ncbi:UvrD-helicase domain-containing protein [Williamsia herbipolensis]|uniref:UvrD-helicase domain-containing protein n=1 Tax=Williamsia herbipolensis TaxID=1603258 RepID=UPI0005F7D0B5|nr:UvrD-helicase domain-containing protein [Williamsia herbipolensis]